MHWLWRLYVRNGARIKWCPFLWHNTFAKKRKKVSIQTPTRPLSRTPIQKDALSCCTLSNLRKCESQTLQTHGLEFNPHIYCLDLVPAYYIWILSEEENKIIILEKAHSNTFTWTIYTPEGTTWVWNPMAAETFPTHTQNPNVSLLLCFPITYTQEWANTLLPVPLSNLTWNTWKHLFRQAL